VHNLLLVSQFIQNFHLPRSNNIQFKDKVMGIGEWELLQLNQVLEITNSTLCILFLYMTQKNFIVKINLEISIKDGVFNKFLLKFMQKIKIFKL